MRILMITIFILSCIGVAAEEPEENPMPSSAKRTIAQHDREVRRLRERYLADLEEIREDTLRDLERDMEKTTRRGNLEGALAIKEKIEALEAQAEEAVEEPTDFLGRREGLRILQATWGVDDREVDVTEGLNELVNDDALETGAYVKDVLPRFADDPAHGIVKNLTIVYVRDGRKETLVLTDRDRLNIP